MISIPAKYVFSPIYSPPPKDGTSSHWEPGKNNTTGKKITPNPADWREEDEIKLSLCVHLIILGDHQILQ